MNSLRDEMLGTAREVPEFRMLTPPGWENHTTDRAGEEQLLARAKARLMSAHQPAAYAMLSAHVGQAFASARRQGAFLLIAPGENAPAGAFSPISILGSMIESTAEMSLDARISDAIERRGARPLDGSGRFLRWTHRSRVRLDQDDAATTTHVYVTPVPGSGRAKALQFTATLLHPDDVDPETDDVLVGWTEMVDAAISTFAWVRA